MATVVKSRAGRYVGALMPRAHASPRPAPRAHAARKPGPPLRAPAATYTRPRTAPSSAAERRRVTQELRALAHPLRLRLLEFFADEPRTTMQVAALMSEPPT